MDNKEGKNNEISVDEVVRIFSRALRTGTLPQEDERYIAQLIARQTGLTEQQTKQRVSDGFTQVQTTLREAETAAGVLAVFGGRQRDV